MKMDRLSPARCPLFGYALNEMKVDGQRISSRFLRPELQESLGEGGLRQGRRGALQVLREGTRRLRHGGAPPRRPPILECFKNRGTVEDYCKIIPLGLSE